MSPREFFYKYYLEPIYKGTGYNPINTLTYAIILVLGLLVLNKIFERMGIEIDSRFVRAVIPFVILGSSLRVCVDSGTIPWTPWLVTPGIYATVFSIFSLSLAISLIIERRSSSLPYHRVLMAIGIILAAPFLILDLSMIREWGFFLSIIALSLATTILAYLPISRLDCWMSQGMIAAHMLDASATFVGVDFLGYWEQHVLPRYLIDLSGTAAIMYPLKLAILYPLIYILSGEEGNLANFIKLVIVILGLAPGLRDLLRVSIGV